VSFFNTDYATNQLIDESWWGKQPPYKDPNQTEIQFFFPLTEQIDLEMSYEGCDTQPKLIRNEYPLGNGFAYNWATVSTTVTPQLTITPIHSVGELSIGGIRVGLEKKPTWLQTQLHKLLGFNWKDK
jgi:hypothetical protein